MSCSAAFGKPTSLDTPKPSSKWSAKPTRCKDLSPTNSRIRKCKGLPWITHNFQKNGFRMQRQPGCRSSCSAPRTSWHPAHASPQCQIERGTCAKPGAAVVAVGMREEKKNLGNQQFSHHLTHPQLSMRRPPRNISKWSREVSLTPAEFHRAFRSESLNYTGKAPQTMSGVGSESTKYKQQ